MATEEAAGHQEEPHGEHHGQRRARLPPARRVADGGGQVGKHEAGRFDQDGKVYPVPGVFEPDVTSQGEPHDVATHGQGQDAAGSLPAAASQHGHAQGEGGGQSHG